MRCNGVGVFVFAGCVGEDGKAVVECSPACKVRFHCDKHPTRISRSDDGTLTHAELGVNGYKYIRAVVIDKDGKFAWTNPIYLD